MSCGGSNIGSGGGGGGGAIGHLGVHRMPAIATALTGATVGRQPSAMCGEKFPLLPPHLQQQQQHQPPHQHHQLHQPPSNMGPQQRGDDGSSGYGSPDSETFETPQAQ